jgi:Ca2+-binding RTX toxin-like protein
MRPIKNADIINLMLPASIDPITASQAAIAPVIPDAGQVQSGAGGSVYLGDQRARIIGVEIDLPAKPFAVVPRSGQYKWEATQWGASGELLGGVAHAGFHDVITASDGNNTVLGLGGNDALDGAAGSDWIDGGEGHDLLTGGAGKDYLFGGAGNDVILGGSQLTVKRSIMGNVQQWSAIGSVTQLSLSIIRSGQGSLASASMGEDGDFIDGGQGNDYVVGGLGQDWIEGGAGNDILWGHGGDDMLLGGDGQDYLHGDGLLDNRMYLSVAAAQHGRDVLDGGAGDDRVVGGGGDDLLFGGAGMDNLYGDQGDVGDVYLDGQWHGRDVLDGGDGSDDLSGSGNADVLYGGDGNDRIGGDLDAFLYYSRPLATQYHGNDTIDGGAGLAVAAVLKDPTSQNIVGATQLSILRAANPSKALKNIGQQLVRRNLQRLTQTHQHRQRRLIGCHLQLTKVSAPNISAMR